jgi:hypothetical protein
MRTTKLAFSQDILASIVFIICIMLVYKALPFNFNHLNRPACIGSVFSAYGEIVWRQRKEAADPSTVWIPLVAGGSARFLVSSFTAPFKLLRTRQATAIGRSQESVGLIHELRSIIHQEGIEVWRRRYVAMFPFRQCTGFVSKAFARCGRSVPRNLRRIMISSTPAINSIKSTIDNI